MALMMDYQKGYEGIAEDVGGGIERAGTAIGQAVQNIPRMRLQALQLEEAEMKMDRIRKEPKIAKEMQHRSIDELREAFGKIMPVAEWGPIESKLKSFDVTTENGKQRFGDAAETLYSLLNLNVKNEQQYGSSVKLPKIIPAALGTSAHLSYINEAGPANFQAFTTKGIDKVLQDFFAEPDNQGLNEEEAFRKFTGSEKGSKLARMKDIQTVFGMAYTNFADQTKRISAQAASTRAAGGSKGAAKENPAYKDLANMLAKAQGNYMTSLLDPEAKRKQIQEIIGQQIVLEEAAGLGLPDPSRVDVAKVFRDVSLGKEDSNFDKRLITAVKQRLRDVETLTDQAVEGATTGNVPAAPAGGATGARGDEGATEPAPKATATASPRGGGGEAGFGQGMAKIEETLNESEKRLWDIALKQATARGKTEEEARVIAETAVNQLRKDQGMGQ